MTAPLRLTNTLTRRKEEFRPIDPANVRMYVCGPTVYDFAHIGNARPIIVFDLLFRLLRHLYGPGHVTYVRNVTDVDDKINARAAERGISIRELTDGTLAQFHEDIRALGVLMPEDVNVPGERPRMVEPRATDHVEEMRRLIERLVASGHAYVAEDHVLFDVPSMPDYGSLSKRPLDEMEAGARVDVAPYKRSPLDFVLWKPSKAGEPSWPSPAGIAAPGRPGWHIECSAMSWKHLGETFDIHAGGLDLIFPHHENEIAQSRCCFGTPVMANYWLHNGFLQVEGDKMSKSLGNFVTIRDALRDWPGEVIRLNMLKTHYRQPIDWTVRGLEESWKTLASWRGRAGLEPAAPDERFAPSVLDALLDDLNTPKAIVELHELERDSESLLWPTLRALGFRGELENPKAAEIDAAAVQEKIKRRLAARAAKNWAESDRIRDELKAMGVLLKDNKDGTTTWEVARP
ncbi:cysteine--tRNA ligase [Enterovirga aerilata]|uniref:Cysteine--tRNA ligase n=1 Tax=Enterovirga aerilata TaxID=2730920 RepID=A0A849I7N4_9HYPH|nr:cysteine--tRNA ligase [Enterovirga sp. DB1703]NNM72305.1 cysteine--tRNA ligase [Enterovirga sp. DB1703]